MKENTQARRSLITYHAPSLKELTMRGHEGRSSDERDVGRRGEHVRRRRRETSPMLVPLLHNLRLHR